MPELNNAEVNDEQAVVDIYRPTFTPIELGYFDNSLSKTLKEVRNHDGVFGVSVEKVTYAFGSILSVGGVSFVLRGGVLAAAMMSTIPTWARFDPISVVYGKSEEEAEEKSEFEQMKEFVQSARARVAGGAKT